MRNKQITLTIQEWELLDAWLGTHYARENWYQNWDGSIVEGQEKEYQKWQEEYEATENAIKKLNKKIYGKK
jgi:hypothetical protein